MDENSGCWYWAGYWLSWALIFIGTWIYCIAEYGFLLGVGLGWLPSGIVATIVSFFWPLILLAGIWMFLKYG
ncbi:TPA: hypothetical protein QEL68_000696 [Stenotrophomonas maltophilia]|nr:hypothetical protein [Stenotrophomonas maltophilia]